MRIAVFDIDGTLTDTNDIDVECYEAAVLSEIGLEVPSDWTSFEDVTDATVLAVACERRGLPVPDQRVQERIARKAGELLAAALDRTPERFRPIPGAREIFTSLECAGWKVAMATGAWRPSALVKLTGAGIPYGGVPLASASEHSARVDIIRHAVRLITSTTPDTVVYIGDRVWDGRAAKALGYAFVAVGQEEHADQLRRVGATSVVQDFTDAQSLVEHLAGLTT
jgi:phosphoglycolate phosphatase-like HAD superfamily hydrolase